MWRRRAYDFAIYLLVAVGAWWVAAGLWHAGKDAYWAASARYRHWRDDRPVEWLPVRPGDHQRYPRAGFGLVYEHPSGYRVDTFAGTATSGRFGMRDTTLDLRLSDAQLDTLYEDVTRMRLFDYGAQPPYRKATTDSSRRTRLFVRAGQATKQLAWLEEGGSYYVFRSRPVPMEWRRLNHLLYAMDKMVRSDPRFPRPREGID